MSFWSILALVFAVLYWRERQQKQELADHKRQLIKRVTHLEAVVYPAPSGPDNSDNAIREVEQLRERVNVLERIATDENSSEARNARAIAAEIESLRGDLAGRASTKEEQSE